MSSWALVTESKSRIIKDQESQWSIVVGIAHAAIEFRYLCPFQIDDAIITSYAVGTAGEIVPILFATDIVTTLWETIAHQTMH